MKGGKIVKVKSDFITNSSSTSFIVWGITIDENELKEKHGENIFASKHVILGPDIVNKTRDEFFNENFYYGFQELAEKQGLQVSRMEYESEIMIGVSPFDMEENQTLKQFKEEIIKCFHKIGINIKSNDLHTIEECWRDG